jgi:hypothetical protein
MAKAAVKKSTKKKTSKSDEKLPIVPKVSLGRKQSTKEKNKITKY